MHPLGKSPVRLTDGDLTVAESGAIADYLVNRYDNGQLAPEPNTPERLRYTYWLHYAEGSAMPPLLLDLVFAEVKKKAPFLIRPIARAIAGQAQSSFIQPQIALHLDYMEAELHKAEWFVSDQFTAADIQLSFPLEAAANRASLNASRPKLMAFLERIHARPAYQKALERGGEYDLIKT